RRGPDFQGAFGGQCGDRAAAGADSDDVDHGDLARVYAHRAFGGQRGLTIDDDGHIGGRAAAVAGQNAVEAGDLAHHGRAESARGRSGQDGGDRLVDDLVSTEDAAVGLHDVERDVAVRVGGRELVEALFDVVDVARESWFDCGIDQRRHGAFIFAIFAKDLR